MFAAKFDVVYINLMLSSLEALEGYFIIVSLKIKSNAVFFQKYFCFLYENDQKNCNFLLSIEYCNMIN